MTIQELKDLVRLKIAGQGTMVDAGGALPPVLNGILDTLAATQNVESVVVTVDGGEGTPSADATFADGVLTLAFHNLKGEKGDQGNTGSSVDYPFELVNNVTTDDATKALSAAQGVVLDGKISQLGQEVTYVAQEVSGETIQFVPQWLWEGQYIDLSGVRHSASNWNISVPFVLGKGQTITVQSQGSGAAIIAKPLNANSYTPLVSAPSGTTGLHTYSYTASEDVTIVVAPKYGLGDVTIQTSQEGLLYLKDDTSNILQALYMNSKYIHYIEGDEFIRGTLILADGSTESNSNWCKTAAIQVSKGQCVAFYTRSTGYVAPLLCLTDANETFYTPLLMSGDMDWKWYRYTMEQDGYVVIQAGEAGQTDAYAYIFEDSPRLKAIEEQLQEGSTSTTINALNPKNVYKNLMQQMARPSMVGNVLQAQPLVLGWFSDIHADEANLKRIKEYFDEYSSYVADVIHTGDSVFNELSDGMAFWNRAGVQSYLNVVGNHDAASTYNGSLIAPPDPNAVSSKAVYDVIIKPYVSSWGVVQPTGAEANGYNYYYKDYTTQKIRLVVLDCMYYDSTQNTWFSGVLSNTPQGYSVVVASHYCPDVITPLDTPFNSLQGTIPSTYSMPSAVDAVSSFIENGGNFVCWIAGHTHIDYIGKLQRDTRQLCIVVENGGIDDGWNDSTRTEGTKSQDAFNVIAFDIYSSIIKIIRVGDDYDHYMRHKMTLCYDYAQGILIKVV